ncbi:MAG: hypothetical protein ABI895_25890 [Deltaproteobacteria bacterium]
MKTRADFTLSSPGWPARVGALAALACSFACQASVQADANLNTGTGSDQPVSDFDRPLEASAAEAGADSAQGEAYALLGARHDVSHAGAKTASCQCLAVALSDHADDASFQWELATPRLEPSTQYVLAFTSSGVSCDAPPAGTLGASYQGYAVEGNDVVVSVEALGEGRPMTSGAIIPRPLGNGSVFIEPAGAIYGKPLEGKAKRCKITPGGAAPSAAIFPGVTGGTAAGTKPAAPAKPATPSKP